MNEYILEITMPYLIFIISIMAMFGFGIGIGLYLGIKQGLKLKIR